MSAPKPHPKGGGGMGYPTFMAMIATSTVVMYGLMYLNTYTLDHIFFSETRFWMAFVMGAVMAVIMLGFMWSMYGNVTKNLIILGVAAAVFAGGLWLVRSQVSVGDINYMKAMIPHHSIAVMTSERSNLRDPRVRKLAEGIIVAQRREIAEMKYLIDDISRTRCATHRIAQGAGTMRPLTIASLGLAGVLAACNSNTAPGNDKLAGLEKPRVAAPRTDAATGLANVSPDGLYPDVMNKADLASIGGGAGRCVFRMTEVGLPAFVYGGSRAEGTIKLNGKLITIPARSPGGYAGGDLSVEVRQRDASGGDATVIMRLAGTPDELGFRGFARCNG